MREVPCPHCNATNRRPKCGSCQKEIADPAAITLAWKLFHHRKIVGIASTVILLFIGCFGSYYLLYPTNISGCYEQAALSARSNDAMRVLMRIWDWASERTNFARETFARFPNLAMSLPV
jgi:hypothetical protein